ncbi:hypothetical protein [Acinetobacter lwoffii]|uniref:hypothetical protein n=1 Tax=Acinetobacter lwoffii TaxID=28090 RepID=UPI00168CE2CA|nr:hypothetical protein [Acinetobacter lwoffii]
MEKDKTFWSKYTNSKFYKCYKGLPVAVVGLAAFLSIILFLTLLFNRYWSGLGADPTREWLLPLTRDKQEFIEYATLYIYLISFGATMFAGLAVFLVFNDWKEQKRYDLGHKYADNSLTILNTIFKELNSRYAHFQIENLLDDNQLVAINEIHKYKYDLNAHLYELSANSKILIDLQSKLLNEEDLNNLENASLILRAALLQIEYKYLSYYYALPDKMKEVNYTTTLCKNDQIDNLALINGREYFFRKTLIGPIELVKSSSSIEDENEKQNLIISEYHNNFRAEYENYQKKLIDIIKI